LRVKTVTALIRRLANRLVQQENRKYTRLLHRIVKNSHRVSANLHKHSVLRYIVVIDLKDPDFTEFSFPITPPLPARHDYPIFGSAIECIPPRPLLRSGISSRRFAARLSRLSARSQLGLDMHRVRDP